MVHSPDMDDLGKKLEKARTDRGFSRREALDRAGFKDSPPSRLANYESGLREPSLAELARLAKGLELSLIELLQYGSARPLVELEEEQMEFLAMLRDMEPEEIALWKKRGKAILEARGDTSAPITKDRVTTQNVVERAR